MSNFASLVQLLAFLAVLLVSLVLYALLRLPEMLAPRKTSRGEFIAEAWLEWEICRGSTMYRQRFRRQWQAKLAAKTYAVVLDWCLPKCYRAEYSNGRPYWEDYGFEIRYGVRRATERESAPSFRPVWTTTMPGHRGHAGEHREGHPLLQGDGLSGSLEGYKL